MAGRGRGREFEDLDIVMKKMEHWAHRYTISSGTTSGFLCALFSFLMCPYCFLCVVIFFFSRLYPKLPFDDTLDIIANRLGKQFLLNMEGLPELIVCGSIGNK